MQREEFISVQISLESYRRRTVLMIFVLMSLVSASQQITPQVINSAGGLRTGSNNYTLEDNVGEPFTSTIANGNFIITQGFLQPLVSSSGNFSYTIMKQDLLCQGRESDGFVKVELKAPPHVRNFAATYLWNNGACPSNDCAKLDSIGAGNYQVVINISYTTNTGAQRNDTIRPALVQVLDAASPCVITIYNGVTPNGDGVNDTWQIDNIAEFPLNTVSVYNRWGMKVYEEKGYNNRERSFPTQDLLNKLPASTYFYIIDLGDKTTKPFKGWLELIKTN